jgi:hypothetical protein
MVTATAAAAMIVVKARTLTTTRTIRGVSLIITQMYRTVEPRAFATKAPTNRLKLRKLRRIVALLSCKEMKASLAVLNYSMVI